MALSNLRQGNSSTDPNGGTFSGPAGAPSNITINGVVSGTTSTMEFTVSSVDATRIGASISADQSTVQLTTNPGSGSVTYQVDDSINVKNSPGGTAVMKISVNGSGPYTYNKVRLPERKRETA